MKNDDLRNAIKKDLEELKNIGCSVPANAFKILEMEDMAEYENMKFHEASDLIIALS